MSGEQLRLVTFSHTPAEQVIQKLRREIDRVHKSSDCESAKDHVINAFMTAWHVHEWIWDAIKDKPEVKAAVFSYRGIQDQKIENQKALASALAQRFVPLKICRIIATSPTHVDVILASEIPSHSSQVEETARTADGEIEGNSLQLDQPAQTIPMVVIMGRPVSAIRLLLEIDEYWITLINECEIER